GANNDINVLDNSPLFDDLLDDIAYVAPFVVNGVGFEKGTLLLLTCFWHADILFDPRALLFTPLNQVTGFLCRVGCYKSSVENLVPNPSKSEDEREGDVPTHDDFTTFSNLLFDVDDDFSPSNNESFSVEDIPKEIYSNPLFDEDIISIKIDPHHLDAGSDLIESLLNHDSSIISSSKFDSLLDEFADELILFKSIPSGIDEADYDPKEEIRLIEKLLYDNSSPHPPKEFIYENSDAVIESFFPSPIPVEDSDSLMDEIDLSLTPDDSMPLGIEDDNYDSEGDMLILEELLSNDSLSVFENESFHFDISSSPRPPAKPPDDDIEPNSEILTAKVVGDISEHYVPIPGLLPTQPILAANEEKSPHLLSHRGLKAF
nr:protein ALP1-like [Tanacetum cinerariifolium]